MTGRPLRSLSVLAIALAALVGAAPAVVLPQAGDLLARVVELTAPEMEGRGSATPGGERAARHLAGLLAAARLKPGGDGETFFQSFVVAPGTRIAPGSSLEVVTPARETLEMGREWQPHGGSMPGEAAGEVVFVGYGVADPARGWDDYASVDVRDRIALALDGAPAALGDRRPSRLQKLIAARQHGARGVLLVGDRLPSPAATAASVAVVSCAITRAGADAVLGASGKTVGELAAALGDRPASFATGAHARLRVDLAPEDRRAANVIGILPGTDPALAAEAVLVGAHYDHLGRIGGRVHPGADDNASGTAVVVELARSFAAAGGAPRTLVFVLFSGEELGLLGSRHYVREPAWPLERTVAMLNFDMVGRLREGRLTVGGVASGSGLAGVVRAAAAQGGPDPVVRDAPFAPSDHAGFYGARLPVLFFHTGVHDDYHRPSDTADKVDAAGMARVAAIGARVVSALAGGARPAFARVAPSARPAAVGRDPGAAFLGVAPDARESDGLRLGAIVPGGAAARAGLRDGDVLVQAGGVAVDSFEDLKRVLRAQRPGDTIRLVYLRDGLDRTASTTLDARP